MMGRHSPGARGITVVELLVALAVGLLVTLAAGTLLVSANAGFTAHTEAAQVDSAGRFVLESIERAVRQAAWLDWDSDDAAPVHADDLPPRIGGLDARTLTRASVAVSDPRPHAANGGASDVLALRFAGAGAGPDGDGSMIGCAGFGIGRQDEGWSIFYVAPNARGVAELRCKYRGERNWTADALVAGVDTFQVLYGIDTDAERDGVVNRYVSASVIDALDAALILEGDNEAERARDLRRKTHWKRVASVKVGLVLHGAKRSRIGSTPALFDVFGPDYTALAGANDPGTRVDEARMARDLRERERHAFAATVLLRNPAM